MVPTCWSMGRKSAPSARRRRGWAYWRRGPASASAACFGAPGRRGAEQAAALAEAALDSRAEAQWRARRNGPAVVADPHTFETHQH